MPLPKTPQEYGEALKKVGADTRCSSCGAEHWVIAPESAIPGEKVGRKPVHMAACVKCGFIRLHSPAALDLMRPPLSDASG
jgi:hypothetical protein